MLNTKVLWLEKKKIKVALGPGVDMEGQRRDCDWGAGCGTPGESMGVLCEKKKKKYGPLNIKACSTYDVEDFFFQLWKWLSGTAGQKETTTNGQKVNSSSASSLPHRKKKFGPAIPCIKIGLIETFIYVKSPTHTVELTSGAKDWESTSS